MGNTFNLKYATEAEIKEKKIIQIHVNIALTNNYIIYETKNTYNLESHIYLSIILVSL